jgi:hypothetical protein
MTDIELLRERIDTMIAERDAERITYNDAIADLIATNERLRATLLQIANLNGVSTRLDAQKIANRALEPKP